MTYNGSFTLKDLFELLIKLSNFPHKNPKFAENMMRSFGNAEEMHKIIEKQCDYREQTHCYLCGSEAICLIVNGFAYLDLENNESGIRELEKAVLHFRNEDMTWSLIIGLILLGIAHEKIKKNHRALREYEKAHKAIKDYLCFYEKDYIEDAFSLEKMIQGKIDTLSS